MLQKTKSHQSMQHHGNKATSKFDNKQKPHLTLVAVKTLTLLEQIPILGYYANSADPVQMPPNVASDQGLHCLLTEILMKKMQ